MCYKQILLTFLAFAQVATIVKSAELQAAQDQAAEPNEYLQGMSLGLSFWLYWRPPELTDTPKF